MKSKPREKPEKPSQRPFLYRGFRIIKRSPSHYTIHGSAGDPSLWAESLEQAMAVIDDMM